MVVEPSSAPRRFVASTAPSRSDLCRKSRKNSRLAQPRRAPPTSSSSRLRSPLARYLLLTASLIMIGLCFRYLWRQLAGLVGAALILSTARRWSGGSTTRGAVPGSGKGSTLSPKIISTADPALKVTGQQDGLGGSTQGIGFADAPAAWRQFWEDGGPGCKLLVRGPKYTQDRRKVFR